MDIRRPGRSSRKLWRIATPLALGTVLLGLGLTAFSLQSRPPAVDADAIWIGEVRRGEFLREVTAAGRLVARDARVVTNRTNGVVERIAVLPGDTVQADTVLLEMSSPQLDNALAEARWELAEAIANQELQAAEAKARQLDLVAQVAAAESEYLSRKMELEAQQALLESGLFSKIEIERTRLAVEQLQRRLEAEQARLQRFPERLQAEQDAANARIQRLREKVARLEADYAALRVTAGSNGVVREVNVEEGEQLVAGTAIARIVNVEELVAQVRVSERDAAMVTPGLPATLEIGRDVYRGRVVRVEPTVRERAVTVDIALLDESLDGLRPDLSLTARIELERVSDAVVVERPAGVKGDHASLTVFRLNRSGDRAERQLIEIGRLSSREMEVLRGLVPGDRIILSDMSQWAEQPVLRIR